MEINTSQILKGTLEACILQLIKNKEMYGYEITEQLSNYGLDMVAQGTIYPLLLKLEKENLVTSYLKESNSGPPRKYYSITKNGEEYINSFKNVKQNNKLRSQLNEDNKKYYEELLVSCRMKNTTKKESELEIQLLEILQDLILYQKQGKNFTDVFGNDINKLSSSILVELPKENKGKLLRFSLVYLLILIISSLVPSVFTRTIQPIITMFSILLLALGSAVCLYLLIYKKTDKNKWFIYISSLIIFEISFILIPILNKLKLLPEYLSLEVTVSSNILYLFGIFSALSYIYIFLTFKKYYSKKI